MLESKKRTQLGVAKFIKDNCIVHTDKTDCGACSEHCPTKAVKMVPYGEKGLVIPSVDESICIGCGACEYACPTVPFRAIYINGNTSHLVADLPKIQEPEEVKTGSPSDDFPF
ncbi:MAG: 4Fe-4S binding protein [Tenuifilaceae bacterium]|nr:4Fe-4S binding protein [Tenuifilaceae bacterium]